MMDNLKPKNRMDVSHPGTVANRRQLRKETKSLFGTEAPECLSGRTRRNDGKGAPVSPQEERKVRGGSRGKEESVKAGTDSKKAVEEATAAKEKTSGPDKIAPVALKECCTVVQRLGSPKKPPETQSIPKDASPKEPRQRRAASERPGSNPPPARNNPLKASIPNPSKEQSLDSYREQAKKLESAIAEICFDPLRKVNKETGGQISSKVSELVGIVHKLLLQNSFLEGKLAAVGDSFEKAPADASSKRPSSIEAPRPLRRIDASSMSYASALKSPKSGTPPARKVPQNVVKIFPDVEGKKTARDSEATKRAVLSIVKPARAQVRIRSVKRIHSGGIAIETETHEELKAFMENKKLQKAGLRTTLPTKRNPQIIIFDVPPKMKDEEIVSCIRRQNLKEMTKEEALASLKPRRRFGGKGKKSSNLVLEVSPRIRERLISKERVYVEWSSCRVRDYYDVTRCFKCHGYGHVTRHCKAPKEVCGHCASAGHAFAHCSKAGKPACPTCKASGRPHNHSLRDRSCPAYRAALEIVIAQTKYA